uniref:Uncharacterized protein n=1 Tax=Salix viminalis TaxID=40686 RepID=A0A6N2MBL5_SALVM
MAIRFSAFFQVFIIYSTSLLTILPQNSCNASNTPKLERCGFDAIYNLGTSISDTGNSAVDNPSTWQAKFPYGETIHEATGRPSDGLLIIDYIAKSADLPLVVPYKNLSAAHLSACHGVNFAYSGATALSKEALAKKNITLELIIYSLDGWMIISMDSAIISSLFMMNFGTNDYGLKELREHHPDVQIVYGDLYNAMQSVFDNFKSLGECFFPFIHNDV